MARALTFEEAVTPVAEDYLGASLVVVLAVALCWVGFHVIDYVLARFYLRDHPGALLGIDERGENMPGRWKARGPSHLVTWWVHGLLKSKRADGPDQAHEIATQACADGAYEASVWVLSEVVKCDKSEDGQPDK